MPPSQCSLPGLTPTRLRTLGANWNAGRVMGSQEQDGSNGQDCNQARTGACTHTTHTRFSSHASRSTHCFFCAFLLLHLLFMPFSTVPAGCTERSGNLLKFTQLLIGRGGIQTQAIALRAYVLSHCIILAHTCRHEV